MPKDVHFDDGHLGLAMSSISSLLLHRHVQGHEGLLKVPFQEFDNVSSSM